MTTGLPDYPRAKELVAMSAILDANPIINDLVFKDLTGNCQADTGDNSIKSMLYGHELV